MDFKKLLVSAWESRHSFHLDHETDCYRIFHGYSEGIPGLSIDRYATCAIINKKSEPGVSDEEYKQALLDIFPFQSIVLKTHQKVDESNSQRVRVLHGTVPESLIVKESGNRYYADPISLHTNGLYLDARHTRSWLIENSEGRRVMNLFAHSGSLGIASRLGGAKEVIHLDKSKLMVDRIKKNYELNELIADDRGILIGDLYFHLPRAVKYGQRFSGIILDPPPKVPPPPKAPKHRPEGQDFQYLINICCQLLDPGAWLLCLYHDYNKSHDEMDSDIVEASKNKLMPFWRDVSGMDFPENNENRRTRMTAFRYE